MALKSADECFTRYLRETRERLSDHKSDALWKFHWFTFNPGRGNECCLPSTSQQLTRTHSSRSRRNTNGDRREIRAFISKYNHYFEFVSKISIPEFFLHAMLVTWGGQLLNVMNSSFQELFEMTQRAELFSFHSSAGRTRAEAAFNLSDALKPNKAAAWQHVRTEGRVEHRGGERAPIHHYLLFFFSKWKLNPIYWRNQTKLNEWGLEQS